MLAYTIWRTSVYHLNVRCGNRYPCARLVFPEYAYANLIFICYIIVAEQIKSLLINKQKVKTNFG
ncbi:MAG: hypothetical protein A2X25_01160 [Chloroflexi bacterium GWB2_49_20]|nr:MAG: hypothetical protein A2X25_01160 [Chloroflexi bacterium GWB2_49_20]OGN76837.1 MAG: hypothetical protein A2X26_08945 [Chloroflexi bacterium GWC2_49_37]OGN84357.1 MAG: hypothetical protein A2X27_02960 [Chloroflexi bacterium GWD2_49_16]HCM96707.1 hypothetical protein [Anaerolineae bacterium]